MEYALTKGSGVYIRTGGSTISSNAEAYAMFVDTAAGGKGKWYSYTSNSLAYVHPALSSAHRTHRKEFRDCTVALMWDVVICGTIRDYPGKYSLQEYSYAVLYVIAKASLKNICGSFQFFVLLTLESIHCVDCGTQ